MDPIETRDWLQAIESVIREEGVERAQFLIDQVLNKPVRVVSVFLGAAPVIISILFLLKMNPPTLAIWN